MTNDPDNKLSPIVTKSLSEQVEQRLMDYFKQNSFSEGDPLPKEMELAEYLGVSRNIVREALSRLRMLGFVESKKRKGMIYKEPDLLSGMSKIMDPYLLGTDNLQDIFELRLVLEVGMADLLYLRLTEKDLDELQDIAQREVDDPQYTKLKIRLDYEIEFHGKLYELSGNETLKRFQSMLLPVFLHIMEIESRMKEMPIQSHITHIDLIEVLKNGNPEKFRHAMREHLNPHFDKLKNNY